MQFRQPRIGSTLAGRTTLVGKGLQRLAHHCGHCDILRE
jgi:hypothetical protein